MFGCVKLIVTVCCLVCPAVTFADRPVGLLDPPQGRFNDEWMILRLGGEKVGYAHSTMSRRGDTIKTHMLTVFKIGRAAHTVEISLLQSTRETLSGRPLFFDSITKMGIIEMRTRGVIEEGQAHLTSSQFGIDTDRTVPFPKGAMMAWGLFRAQMEHGFEPGTTYELDVYEPAMSTENAIRSKTVVGERVTIDLLGKRRQAIKVSTTMSTLGGQVESVAFVDEKGSALRVEVVMAGLNITMIAVDKEMALKDFDPPEFFVNTLVKVDRFIDRDAAEHIRYTIRVSGKGRMIPELPVTAMQTPGERTAQSATVDVRRIDRSRLKKLLASTQAHGLQPVASEFLEATPTLNIKDEAIVRMAAAAVGDETRPYLLADKLRVYVSDVIRDKNLNVGFATAGEVCRRREGDCTEHSVLLAALGRARGLPSRVVVGLAYVSSFAGTKNVFGFHMWTQFYIGDQWVDFDAALRESDCSPARIALATSSLKDAGIGDMAFAIMDIITGLKIDIDAIESR